MGALVVPDYGLVDQPLIDLHLYAVVSGVVRARSQVVENHDKGHVPCPDNRTLHYWNPQCNKKDKIVVDKLSTLSYCLGQRYDKGDQGRFREAVLENLGPPALVPSRGEVVRCRTP